MRTSYSALDSFETCPQKYKYEHIEKIRGDKSPEQIFGTLVHSALEHYYSKSPTFPTTDEVITRFRDRVKASELPDADKPRYEQSGVDMISRFAKKNPAWGARNIGLETRFAVDVIDPESHETHTLSGIIDRVDAPDDNTVEIIDYKTSRKLPAQSEVDHNLQLSVYHMAALKRWPSFAEKAIKLSLYFLRANEKLTTTRTPADIAETENHVREVIRHIEGATTQDEFPPKPSALCEWCSFKPICPAWRHLYARASISPHATPTDIDASLDEYFEARSAKEKADDRMKELAHILEQHMAEERLDRLFSPHGTLSRAMRETESWNMDTASPLLEEAGVLNKVLAPDPKKLKTILPELPPELRAKITAVARSIKTSFSLRAGKAIKTPDDALLSDTDDQRTES